MMDMWTFIENNYSVLQTIKLWNEYCKAVGRTDIIYKMKDFEILHGDSFKVIFPQIAYFDATDKYFVRFYDNTIYSFRNASEALEETVEYNTLSKYYNEHPYDDKMKKYVEENS